MVSTLYPVAARRLDEHRFSLGAVADLSREMARGNPQLIWGWKRDVGASSRIVYFGGDLAGVDGEAVLQRWFLFYRHRGAPESVERFAQLLADSDEVKPHIKSLKLTSRPDGLADLRVELGRSSAPDLDRVRRLQLRRPRRRLADVVMPEALPLARAADFLPADIYVGSGLSYEAGLPTLCDMHLAFGVDNAACTQFAVGDEDLLPPRLAGDLAATLGGFCAVHVGALRAPPTFAMQAIADLRRSGHIRRVFTDNVDNLLAKVDVPFERTRGSGVFNEVYPATFDSRRLIVIGVAADRRSLVKQARAKGLQIVTVNPCEKVAPMVRHLDYIRPGDPFFRTTAEGYFGELRKAVLAAAGAPPRSAEIELA